MTVFVGPDWMSPLASRPNAATVPFGDVEKLVRSSRVRAGFSARGCGRLPPVPVVWNACTSPLPSSGNSDTFGVFRFAVYRRRPRDIVAGSALPVLTLPRPNGMMAPEDGWPTGRDRSGRPGCVPHAPRHLVERG